MTRHQPLDEFVAERLPTKEDALSYMNTALEEYRQDHDDQALLIVIRQIAMSKGGMALLAEKTGKSRTSLYKTLSGQRSPRLDTFTAILRSLGYEMDIRPAH